MWLPAAVLLLVVVLTLMVGALISLHRTELVSSGARALWFTVIFLLPVVGALAWLATLQRRTRSAEMTDEGTVSG